MKLVESYSSISSLPINDKPLILEKFYALPLNRYITLQGGAGFSSKCYEYYQEIVNCLLPYLAKENIQIVLLGGRDDPGYQGVYDLRGKTSLHQSYYLLNRSILHLGGDSWLSHAAGWSNIPLVSLYGSTDPQIHGPYWKEGKMTLIESHRRGHKPTFFAQESPKTINFIDPFLVAKSVLDLLSIPHSISQRTLHVGHTYNATLFDWICDMPVSPQFNPDMPLAARMDLNHDENVLAATLQTGRKVNLLTKAPINLQLLAAFKGSIQSFNFEINEETPLDYIKSVKKTLQNLTFFSRTADLDELSRIRFKFFDIINVQHILNKTRADFEKESAEYQNIPLDDAKKGLDSLLKDSRLRFHTNKFVLSQGKTYLSLAHAAADIPMEGDKRDGVVLDGPEFWRDINHFLVYA